MAWRSNIPQKSFLCERLFIPSEEWFVFYMQMTISTTGRRQLCILCSVCVLSKMLKLCGAEGSSFRWLMGAGSCFCEFPPICFWSGSRCWAVFCLLEVHQIDPLWCCCQALTDAFSGWDPLKFWGGSRFWSSILDTVNRLCWSSIGATVRGTIFGCCQLLLVDQRPGGFIRLIDCWVSSELSGRSALCWGPSDFSEVDLFQCWVFWDEVCQMVSLQWLEPFDACQWLVVSDRCLITYSFCWDPSAFRFLRWISLLGNVLFLAICHWHWYHSLFVTFVRFLGSLMAQGSVWVSASAVEFLKQHLVFVTMS
jgi:hypothetical protein